MAIQIRFEQLINIFALFRSSSPTEVFSKWMGQQSSVRDATWRQWRGTSVGNPNFPKGTTRERRARQSALYYPGWQSSHNYARALSRRHHCQISTSYQLTSSITKWSFFLPDALCLHFILFNIFLRQSYFLLTFRTQILKPGSCLSQCLNKSHKINSFSSDSHNSNHEFLNKHMSLSIQWYIHRGHPPHEFWAYFTKCN